MIRLPTSNSRHLINNTLVPHPTFLQSSQWCIFYKLWPYYMYIKCILYNSPPHPERTVGEHTKSSGCRTSQVPSRNCIRKRTVLCQCWSDLPSPSSVCVGSGDTQRRESQERACHVIPSRVITRSPDRPVTCYPGHLIDLLRVTPVMW